MSSLAWAASMWTYQISRNVCMKAFICMTHIPNRGQISCPWAPHVLPSKSIYILSNSDNRRHTFAFMQSDVSQTEQQTLWLISSLRATGLIWGVNPVVPLSNNRKLLITLDSSINTSLGHKIQMRSFLQVGSSDLAGSSRRSQTSNSRMRSGLISFTN